MSLCIASGLAGQNTNARLTGLILDPSRAVVAAAEITVINPDNGIRRSAVSGNGGIYVVPLLPPGVYDVTVQKDGFKPAVRKGIKLGVEQTVRADFVLAVGEVTQIIEVTGSGLRLDASLSAPPLQTSSGERSSVITPVVLRSIALNGRNTFDLFKTLPGVAANPSAVNAGLSGAQRFNVNGTRSGMSEFAIDGATSKNLGDMGQSGVSMNPDAIAEVRIVTSNYQAEYGRVGGASIAFVTKSGTNDLHASVRSFRRHDSLNANRFFNKVVTPNSPRPRYRYNYTGYEIAGPVVIPRVVDGRNKLFFYWNQEFYLQTLPTSRKDFWTPTGLQRKGDFSQTMDGNGNPLSIRDPLTGSGRLAAYFPDNKIPVSRIYAPGASALNFFPQPNFQGDFRYNYSSQASDDYPRREDIFRGDYQLSGGTWIAAHFINNYDRHRMPYGPPFSGWPWPLSSGGWSQPGRNAAITVTHMVRPTLGNEFTAGRQTLHVAIAPLDDNVTRQATGIATPLLYPTALRMDAAPSLAFGGVANLTSPYLMTGYPFRQSMPITNLSDNLTKVHGSHTLKFGVYLHLGAEATTKTVNQQTQSKIDFAANAANPLDTGHPFANALLGVYNSYTQSATWVEPTMRYHNLEWYAQDSWRVRRGLVLDYGLRFISAPVENDATYARPFYADLWQRSSAPRLYTPILLSDGSRRVADPAAIPATPTLANTLPISYATLVVPGTGDLANGTTRPRGALAHTAPVLLGPRFGFAYCPFGRDNTVVRGGFGVSFDRTRTSVFGSSTINPPNGLMTTLQYGWLSDIATLRDQPLTVGAPNVDGAYPRSIGLPMVMSYSLGIQRDIGGGFALDVAYVANLQRHLGQLSDLNAIPYGSMFQRESQDPSQFSGGAVPAVEPGLPSAYASAGLAFTGRYALPVNLRRPYSGLGTINYRTFDGSANYNSLQAAVRRNLARAIAVNAAYTWSKTLGTSWDDQNGTVSAFDTRGHDYMLATFDRTHTFTIDYVLTAPPVGDWLGAGRAARALLNGWQLSGLTTAATGTPYELSVGISDAGGWAITGSDTEGPRFLRTARSASAPAGLEIDPLAFQVPAPGSRGYGPRQYLRAPGFINHDVSVFKNFHYSRIEGRYLQLRLELFNALNHANFTGVNSATNITAPGGQTGLTAFDSNPATLGITNNLRPAGSTKPLGTYFGEFNSTLEARVVQLAFKLYF